MKRLTGYRLTLVCGCICLAGGCQTVERIASTSTAPPRVAATEANSSPEEKQAPAPEDSSSEQAREILQTSGSSLQIGNEVPLPPVDSPVPAAVPAPVPGVLQPIPEPTRDNAARAADSAGLTLEMIEQIALQNNPSISQAAASVGKASGFRKQVGAYPNPNVGYSGQQLADAGTDQHLGYVEQEIVTAHKLKLNQRILDQEVQSQLWEVEAQRYRVLTDVRQQFYQALAAQQRRDLAEEFRKVVQEGVRIAEIRRKALEGSVPEVLQTEIQLNEVELIAQRAEIAYDAAWRRLVAAAGVPNMQAARLVGTLRVPSDHRDWNSTYDQLVGSNPALQAARVRVTRAIANMDRQEVQAIPNLQTLTSAGYDYGTNHSMIQVQMGIALPVFNQNLGNISAAQAEYCRAAHEVRRLELALQSQLAEAARQYDSAAITVERYEQQILPKARQTLDLSEKAYSAGEFGFLQVLVARRTFFDSNLQYNDALIELADSKWLIDGMLLSGGLSEGSDTQLDDSLRGQTLSGQ